MKARRIFAGVAALAAITAASWGTNDPLAAKYKQARSRIELLFGHRNEVEAAKPITENPFRVGSTAPVQTTEVPQSGPPPLPQITGDGELLDAGVRSLLISGTTVLRDGSTLVSINQKFYKEGDPIVARLSTGQSVILRVKKIAAAVTGQRGAITFGLNELEITVGL